MSNKTNQAVAQMAVDLARLAPNRASFVVGEVTADLIMLERKAHRLAEDMCNVPMSEAEQNDRRERILKKANAALARLQIKMTPVVEFNGDPRGAGLKLFHPKLPGNTWGGSQAGYAVGV